MTSFRWLLQWGGFLLFCTATIDTLTGEPLTCSPKVRVRFVSETWTGERGWVKSSSDIYHDQFLESIMKNALSVAKENAIECGSDMSSYDIQCCDAGNLDQFNKTLKTGWSKVDGAFMLINVMLALVVVGLGIMLLTGYWEIRSRSAPIERIELT